MFSKRQLLSFILHNEQMNDDNCNIMINISKYHWGTLCIVILFMTTLDLIYNLISVFLYKKSEVCHI